MRWPNGLTQHGEPTAEVIDARSHGTDWAGDSEAGFYERFQVEVTYRTTAGQLRHYTVAGEEMQSLWEFVVKRWPGG